MTTIQDIQAAINEARALNVTAADMVALLDRAIAAAFAAGGSGEVASITYTIAGRSRTLALDQAQRMRQYYAGLAGSAGGLEFVAMEFGL